MSDSLHTAASGVGAQLVVAEKASDKLVMETAGLSLSIMEISAQKGIHFADSQGVLHDIARAHQLSVEARFHMVRAHSRMATVARSKGIDWTMWGDELETPPKALTDTAGTEAPVSVG